MNDLTQTHRPAEDADNLQPGDVVSGDKPARRPLSTDDPTHPGYTNQLTSVVGLETTDHLDKSSGRDGDAGDWTRTRGQGLTDDDGAVDSQTEHVARLEQARVQRERDEGEAQLREPAQ